MDVECPISGHPTGTKIISVHDELVHEDNAILEEDEALVEGEGYELTELKNVGSKLEEEKVMVDNLDTLDSMEPLEELTEENGELEEDIQGSSDDIIHQRNKTNILLAQAVSRYPSLYDPHDPNFNSKNHRGQIWRKVAETILWQGDLPSLQVMWRSLREDYIKHLSKKRASVDPETQALWNSLKWLNRYIQPASERTTLVHASQPQQAHVVQRDFYVDQPQTVAQDVMISGNQVVYQTPQSGSSSQPPHRMGSQHSSSSSQSGGQHSTASGSGSGTGASYYILNNSKSTSGHIRIVAENQHGPPSARVTVVPATRTSNGTAVVQLPPGSYPRNQRVQIIHTPSSSQSSSYDHRVTVGDPGVTVTERGTVGRQMHVVKKEAMIVENGEFYPSGSGQEKMYRVVHMDQHGNQGIAAASPAKRMRIVRTQNQPHQMISMNPSTSRHSLPMATLGEEVVIEDGVADRIVIDQDVQPESPLLSESPGLGTMMISGQHSGLGHSSPGGHPGYLQQSQYDADLQFQQLISSSLARYDDNEKALVKFHIQRILLEARYGTAITKQIVNEDDLDGGENGVPHELVPQ